MEWLYFALFSAVVWGTLSVIAKDIMEDTRSTVYTALYSVLALIFYTPVFIYFVGTSEINYTLAAVGALGFSIIGNILAFIAYNYSIEEGELSRVIPFTRLTPIFASIFGALALNETIDVTLGTGIVTATVGSIILLKEDHISYLTSVEDGLHSEAIKAAILSSIIYGATSVADRFANQIIAPEIYTFFIFLGMTTGMLVIVNDKTGDIKSSLIPSLKEYTGLYLLTGLLAAAATLSIFNAFSLAPASQVTPILQVQVLIPVIAGLILFNEKNLVRKLVGTAILLSGVVLVAI